MCVLVFKHAFFLFSLFITHLDQSPVSQLSPRPILISILSPA